MYKVVIFDGDTSRQQEILIDGSNISHKKNNTVSVFNIVNSKRKIIFSVPMKRFIYCQEITIKSNKTSNLRVVGGNRF